jgi:hypothetical protein
MVDVGVQPKAPVASQFWGSFALQIRIGKPSTISALSAVQYAIHHLGFRV